MPELNQQSSLRLLQIPRKKHRESRPIDMRYMTESELEELASQGAVAFTPSHTVRDLVRYAIERAGGDVEQVMFHASSMRD